MENLENTRNNFTKMRGGKLILIESVILAFVVFFVMLIGKNASLLYSLGVAFAVGFVFPILVGIFKFVAWIAAVLFSLLWSILGFTFVGAIAGQSVLIGLVAAVIIFLISFTIHKNYSGLYFRDVSNKTYNTDNMVVNNSFVSEDVMFCPNCGRRIKNVDGICDACDR